MDHLMLRQELLGKLSGMIATQLEMAKFEEAKKDLAFQIIDKVVPPFKRFSSRRAQICIMFFYKTLTIRV